MNFNIINCINRIINCINSIMSQLIQWLYLVDVNNWENYDEDEYDDDEDNLFDVGNECIQRMANAIGGTPLANLIEQSKILAKDQDWRKRYAFVQLNNNIIDGGKFFLNKKMNEIFNCVTSLKSDPSPIVRYSVIVYANFVFTQVKKCRKLIDPVLNHMIIN